MNPIRHPGPTAATHHPQGQIAATLPRQDQVPVLPHHHPGHREAHPPQGQVVVILVAEGNTTNNLYYETSDSERIFLNGPGQCH
jgi:hypothetical protein